MKKDTKFALFSALLRHAHVLLTSAAQKRASSLTNKNNPTCNSHPELTEKTAFIYSSYNHPTHNCHPELAEKSIFTISDENNLACNCHAELVSASYKHAKKINNKQNPPNVQLSP